MHGLKRFFMGGLLQHNLQQIAKLFSNLNNFITIAATGYDNLDVVKAFI